MTAAVAKQRPEHDERSLLVAELFGSDPAASVAARSAVCATREVAVLFQVSERAGHRLGPTWSAPVGAHPPAVTVATRPSRSTSCSPRPGRGPELRLRSGPTSDPSDLPEHGCNAIARVVAGFSMLIPPCRGGRPLGRLL